MQPLRGIGVHLPQLLQNGFDPLPLQPLLQLLPHFAAGVAAGKAVPFHQRVQPEAGAAYQNGQLASCQNVVNDGHRHLRIAGGRPLLRRIRHRHHMVRHAVHLLFRRGGGADGHAPIDLHGVHGDHFPVKFFRQQYAQRGLSAGRGAYHA